MPNEKAIYAKSYVLDQSTIEQLSLESQISNKDVFPAPLTP